MERSVVDETLGLQPDAQPANTEEMARKWAAQFTTGWESRHVHYGVDETGPGGAYVNEAAVQVGGFDFSVWNGLGLGNDFLEWDFTAAYEIAVGPVFVIPGYNFRYFPARSETGGESQAHEEHGEEEEQHEEEAEPHSGHAHNTHGNELFVSFGTTAVPYVIPSANFIWDLNNNPGGFLELRLDGDIPAYKDVVNLQPYALLGLNFGYNTSDYYGWNNFQFGGQVTCRICKWLSVFAGVNYSVALEALQQTGQENVAWANVGLNFAY
ncbi:MAG: hypothetical protein FGM15_04150 [Chthoniobacterales bacterium]|nr:hypothetical protein [Chthoniobacterales bacterium]